MGPQESTAFSEWGLILAVVFVLVGVGNLLAAYSIARLYSRRQKDKKCSSYQGRTDAKTKGSGPKKM